ncbi:HlyD family efflux transporter periplasmic adaptor subunit [Achromobacter seleniivolatilans]|uniref:HlyD family efflux transporter periplasmic adaptor subunit n=1 Tax=Achromobacter seleniivolatilans TaxID=3047478 RepID=A0ABY9M3R1_9BURK|nr:HlyD family efflux transporter periplasmic adaptor subunit [Achromobacter sp. R39]WMD21590.1 HlyD family efflux transporter periplasmic adaptor subunit [Achromobacter sp. R39]
MNDAVVPAQVKRADLAWWSALSATSDRQSFLDAWLALQASQLPGVRHAALILGEPDSGPFEVASQYPAGSRAGAAFYGVVDESLQGREVAVSADAGALVVAYPIVLDGRIHGVAAFETAKQAPEPLVQALRWGAGVLECWLIQHQETDTAQTVERLMYVINSVARALKEGQFKDVALTLVTDLATRLECDRVSIGFRQDGRSKVYALSHSSRLVQNMNLVRSVAEAMDEAIDQNTTLCLPQDEGRTLQLRAHQSLAREFGNRNVLTVPFAPEGDARGALVFERPDNMPFDRQSIELCQSVVLLAGRVLYQRLQQERPFWRKWRDAAMEESGRLLGPRHIGRKLAVLALIGIVLFACFAHGPYRISATATVQGVVQRVLAAPFDGYISDASRRAGDNVKQGEALAALDTRETELELLRAGNLEVQYRRQAEEASARGDSAAAAIAQAQARQAMAQIQFYREQIQRATLRAPFDGMLVSGDLTQQLGEAVKRGQELFKLSPLDGYRLWLDVEDRLIDDVAVGQTGRVALAAMPDKQIPFTITRIVPLAQVQEGKTVFRLEASLPANVAPQTAPALRPGMEGVGRVDIDERRYVWIWTHGFFDWLRLKWWGWFG